MPHVDEGTLHALLDGELGAAEVLEVQTHFATCPACAARLDEARQLLAETERLVTALEPPAVAAAEAPRLMVGKPMIPLDPVVLIPDNPTPTEVRRNRFRIMAWAAGFLVVVGAGFFGLEMRSSLPGNRKVGNLRIRPEEFTFGTTKGQDSAAAAAAANPSAPPQAPPPQADESQRPSALGIAKPQASAAPPQGAGGARADSAPAAKPPAKQPPTKQPPANQPPAPQELADNTPQAKPQPQPAKAPNKSAPPPARAQQKTQPAPAPAAPPQSLAAAPTQLESKADSQTVVPTGAANDAGTEDRATLAARAAKATEELDRERIRERAAAATADLDRQREQERAAAAEAQRRDSIQAAQRAAPTIDQQARLSSRIGLDEAAHQLGGPLHAIDGMTRQLVGLVSPQLVPGSDATRPVVRAVYVDRTGRTIYLDQQRVRPGQLDLPFTPQTGPNGQQMWMAGSTLLVLQGDLGPDSLRSLARRVR